MGYSIKSKVTIFFAFSILIISLSMGYMMYMGGQIKQNALALEEYRKVEYTVIALHNTSNEMKLNIVGVQQWLTDISATRALDGLNDGFDEAAKQAEEFDNNSQKLLVLVDQYRQLSLSQGYEDGGGLKVIVENVISNFGPYYASGKRMAQAYIDYGPAEGNKLMEKLDSTAEKLDAEMSKVLKISAKLLDKGESDAENNTKFLNETINNSSAFLNILGIVNILMLLLLARYIISSVLKTLTEMTVVMVKLAKGDITADDPKGAERSDEIGAIARAVSIFKDSLIKTTSLLELNQKEREEKEKSQRFMISRIKDFEQTSDLILEGMKTADTTMKKLAKDIGGVVNESNKSADGSVKAAEEASLNVQSVSSAVEELASSVREITRQVSGSSEIASEAMSVARSTNEEIGTLEEKVSKIGNVVQLITDIAEQTNLLALNATIEAARAGDAGKGFAVVASEVKGLASQTAKATEDISKQIKEIQSSTQASAKSIRGIYDVIEKINDISMTISSSVEEQSAAAAEIARSSEQAALKTREASSASSSVKDIIAKLASSVTYVETSSETLSNQTIVFDNSIKTFLEKVQSGAKSNGKTYVSAEHQETGKEVKTEELEGISENVFIKWDDSIAVGKDFIDEEHKKLISIINRFYTAVNAGIYGTEVSKLFDDLVEYTVYHFGHEEEEMKRHNYPERESHINQHKQFIKRISGLYDRYKGGDEAAGKEVLGFLASWLISHIKVIDRKLANFLVSQR